MMSVFKKFHEITKLLLYAGCKLEQFKYSGTIPLHIAVSTNNEKNTIVLVCEYEKRGLCIDTHVGGKTALLIAVEYCNSIIVKIL